MLFTISLYVSLVVFLIGMILRVREWFVLGIGPRSESFTPKQRLSGAMRGISGAILGRRIISLIGALFSDVILQVQILKKSPLRWIMHMSIFIAFMLLLFMHALDETVTQSLFPDYASTLDPFQFLRNLFGVFVLLGVFIAAYRRMTSRNLRVTTHFQDIYAIVILVVIILSGFFLESVKITSPTVFQQMVEDYSELEEPEEIQSLQCYWEKEFGSVFRNSSAGTDEIDESVGRESDEDADSTESEESGDTEELFAQGLDLHEENCASCHSRPISAFVSYPLAKGLKWSGIALLLDSMKADLWLWYLHFLACFIGLAYLPFSKFFHIFSSTVGILTNAASDRESTDPVNRATLRAIGLSACTHCGTCSLHCSVAPIFRVMSNTNILPSEKLTAVKWLREGKNPDLKTLQALQEGSFICTGCGRCSEVCPVGIDLMDLWRASKMSLAETGFSEPHLLANQISFGEWEKINRAYAPNVLFPEITFRRPYLKLPDGPDALYSCVQCQKCTVVCPVVSCNVDPSEGTDITPQQVINLVRMGLREVALSSRMVWNCATCYLCQENCPQGIQITEIIYELRNEAYKRYGTLCKEKNIQDCVAALTNAEAEGGKA